MSARSLLALFASVDLRTHLLIKVGIRVSKGFRRPVALLPLIARSSTSGSVQILHNYLRGNLQAYRQGAVDETEKARPSFRTEPRRRSRQRGTINLTQHNIIPNHTLCTSKVKCVAVPRSRINVLPLFLD